MEIKKAWAYVCLSIKMEIKKSLGICLSEHRNGI